MKTIIEDSEFEKLVIELDLMPREDLNMAHHYKAKLAGGEQLSLAEVCFDLELITEFDLSLLTNGNAEEIPGKTTSFSNVLSPELQSLIQEKATPEPVTPPEQDVYVKEGDSYKVLSTDQENAENVLQAAMAFYQQQAFQSKNNEPASTIPAEPTPSPSLSKPIGEILIEMNAIEEWQVTHALAIQSAAPSKRFGEILLELGYTTPEFVLRALAAQGIT